MFPDEAHERLPRSDLERLQGERLAELVRRLYARVPHYRRKLDDAALQPTEIRGIADLPRLPFTRKSDLREHYPFGLFACPMQALARLHASSGTTGKPTLVGYTSVDLAIWAELCARSLAMGGARPGQIFQNAYGYGLFTGGLGLHYGAERLGLTVVPASTGQTARQILLLKDLGTEILACTPSYALAIADALAERGIRPGDLKLRVLFLGAEPWGEEIRAELEERLSVSALNIYGLSEVMGPGVANECVEAKSGSHVFEDHFAVEVVDPTSGVPLPDGVVGELVFTTLTKQAFPLLRYRSGDLASVTRETCRCGRTLARMSRVVGRTDDLVILRGVNLYPSQVEAALGECQDVAPHYQLVLTRPRRLDDLEIRVEVSEAGFNRLGARAFQDGGEALLPLQNRLAKQFRETLGVEVRVAIFPPRALPRSDGGKLTRILDLRGDRREPSEPQAKAAKP